ncbi:MAG: cytochrome c biogenesis CcdA family protein [bacterium]|nr:cytochrome c biogenesis CcdA family protein [bacterium]
MIEILLAILAGILTIAAPCILLPLPIILGASVGQQSKTRPLFISLGFITSFSIVALTINFLFQSLGLSPNTLRNVSAVLLAIFAMFMIWPLPFEILMSKLNPLINQAHQASQGAGTGNGGGFVIGMIIGIIWAPCAGPILGAILTLIGTQQELARASILLIAYAIGAGIPMLVIAYGGQALSTRIKSFAKYSARVHQVFGIIILGLAIAIFLQYDTVLQAKLLESIPVLNPKF